MDTRISITSPWMVLVGMYLLVLMSISLMTNFTTISTFVWKFMLGSPTRVVRFSSSWVMMMCLCSSTIKRLSILVVSTLPKMPPFLSMPLLPNSVFPLVTTTDSISSIANVTLCNLTSKSLLPLKSTVPIMIGVMLVMVMVNLAANQVIVMTTTLAQLISVLCLTPPLLLAKTSPSTVLLLPSVKQQLV